MEQDKTGSESTHLEDVTKTHAGLYPALFELVKTIYQDVVELDLETGTIFVLRNYDDPQQEGNSYPFVHEVDVFCDRKIMAEDTHIAKQILSLKELRRFYQSDCKSKNVELRVCAKDFAYEWVELSSKICC